MITPILNVSSLLLGLIAWALGARAVARRKVSLLSFGFCLLALVLQFAELTHRAEIGDTFAILDTVRAITLAAATLSAGTISLNALAARRGK